ncbi:MAG: DUF2335 domain-containing protein [Candidatus Acidiferrales bacterium]
MSKEDKLRRRLEQQNRQSGTFQIRASGVQYSGPLPHPDILIKYNDAVLNGADRIIAMAESQSAHRQRLEKAVVDSNCHAQKLGPIYGFIVCMSAIGGGVYLIQLGKQATGLAAIITALASLSVVFIYGKRKQEQDLKQKAEGFIK